MPSLVSRNSAVSNYLLCWSFSGLSPPDTLFTMFSVSSPCTGTCVSRKQPIILEKSGAICSQETIREKALHLCWLFYRMITETVYRRHLCPGVWQSCFVISRSVTNLVPFWRLVILANSLSSIGTWICYVEKYIVEDTYLMLAHRKWHTLCKASTVWLSSSHCRSSCLLLQCSSCCCYQDWWKAWIQKLRRYVVFTVIFSLFVRWWGSKLCLMMQEVGR